MPKYDLVVVTEKGIVIRFPAEQLRQQRRGGQGVRAITLNPDDSVVSATIVESED